MPTITQGLFFVARDGGASRPNASTHRDDNGAFVLRLRVVDNQGPRKVEPYVVRWIGPAAESWWSTNAPLKAGDPLVLELENPRAMTIAGDVVPSIAAHVRTCHKAPPRLPNAAATQRFNPIPQPSPNV